MVQCPQCGNQSPDDARFCAQCGTPLADAGASPENAASDQSDVGSAVEQSGGSGGSGESPAEVTATISDGAIARVDGGEEREALNEADASAVDALPPGSALLIVMRGPGAGSRYLLDRELVTAGRHPESDIFLDDITVSRRHVEFRRSEDRFTVHDVGSLNGTYVNRDRIDDVQLQNGDEVRIGKYRLIYFDSDAKGR